MPVIRQLPPSVINKIAAGEVIERPASVVKELVENSVDSGATRIEVTLGQAGCELIRVADNGCGINAEQLLLAVASHATSKIQDADDLFQVATLGFRGEALASISEVSRFRIASRPAEALAGSQMEVVGGQIGPVEPCGCGVGTTIEVRDLFFNTPVRRKFMKTPATEIAHATEAFTRIAVAYPDRHFVLRNNERVVYDLAPTSHWPERIGALFGVELGAALIAVSGGDGAVRLSGYVADPNFNRGNNRMQYLFLNGRCIRDRSLQHALSEAYRGLILTGRFPIAFLRLDMPADLVDVNVHPQKMEVRFQDSSRLYSHLLGAIRTKFLTTDLTPRVGPGEAVGKSGSAAFGMTRQGATPSPTPAATSHHEGRVQVESLGIENDDAGHLSPSPLERSSLARPSTEFESRPDTGENRPWRLKTPAPATPSLFDSARSAAHRDRVVAWAKGHDSETATATDGQGSAAWEAPAAQASSHTSDQANISADAAASWSGRTADPWTNSPRGGSIPTPHIPLHANGAGTAGISSPPSMSPGASAALPRGVQLLNRYLVTEVDDGMIVIDQHALHERILYEQLREKVLADKLESQRLLVPEPVNLLPAECAAALDACDTLKRLGLEIEPFGGDTVLVSSYPAMLGRTAVGELFRQVVELLVTGAKSPEPRDLVDELLHMMSCKAAVKAGDRLTSDEVEALLRQRHMFRDTHHCPHGRPTALVFTLDELDKHFKRT
jgi:DNA mismatch repair protein MutL